MNKLSYPLELLGREGLLNENVWSELLWPNEKLNPLILLFVTVLDDIDKLGVTPILFPIKLTVGSGAMAGRLELACNEPEMADVCIGLDVKLKVLVVYDVLG